MGLIGLLFILAAAVTGALTYFLKGNVLWKSQSQCTKETLCDKGDENCCVVWDGIDGDVGYCRAGDLTDKTAGTCRARSELLPLCLAVATVALLFTGLIVLLIPSGGSSEVGAGGVSLHLT